MSDYTPCVHCRERKGCRSHRDLCASCYSRPLIRERYYALATDPAWLAAHEARIVAHGVRVFAEDAHAEKRLKQRDRKPKEEGYEQVATHEETRSADSAANA